MFRRFASNAPGLRPSSCLFARSPALWLFAQQRRRCLERQQKAKAEGKTKGRGTGARRKPVCTWGTRHAAASPPCRVRRDGRANAGMSACFARPDTPELAGRTAITDRRDDDFRVRPSTAKNRGQGQSFVSKVLKQASKASGGKSSMRHSAAGGDGGHAGQRPGSCLGRGHTAARFAEEKLTPMSRRVTIKTLLVNHQRACPQSLAKKLPYVEHDGAGRDGELGRAYGPQSKEADFNASRNTAPTTGTISASSSRRKTARNWTTRAPISGIW